MSAIDRLLDRCVESPAGCWVFTGRTTSNGYGFVAIGGQSRMAHRVTYEALVAPIPPGLDLDHLCRHRACCNPAHLEPVPHRVNVLRGEGLAAQNARRTHCKRGHALAGDNVLIERRKDRTSGAQRRCRICRTAKGKASPP